MYSSVQLSLPYNGDPRLVDIVVSDFSDSAVSMYGSFGIDHFGGGRALPAAYHTDEEILKKVVRRLSSKGIEFNYVLNRSFRDNPPRRFDMIE